MSQETDLELLKRGRQGDDEAFGRFRERHLNSVTNVLRRFFRDENDIDLFTNAVPLDSISKKEYSDIEIARRDEEYLAALEIYLNLLTPNVYKKS